MNKVEQQIIQNFITDAVIAGYNISVHDSKKYTIKKNRNPFTIFEAMGATDEDTLFLHGNLNSAEANLSSGWVQFVYGNDGGHEVICDYSTNLENLMTGTNMLVEMLAGAK